MNNMMDKINVRYRTSIDVLPHQLVRVTENQSAMDELKPCSLTPQNFYDSTTSVFLSPPPGASSTGMLASRPMGLRFPPPSSTTMTDACAPLAFAAEGDNSKKASSPH